MRGVLYLCLILTLCGAVFTSCAVAPVDRVEYDKYRSEQNSFITKHGALKYLDKGTGEVIVLLHGVPTSGWVYRKMVDGLVDEGYRVIVPDMLGYGASESPDGIDLYSAENQAERLVALMNRLGVKKWNHVCHDVGGLWTWELASLNHQRIRRLVVLNSIILEEGFRPPVRMKEGKFAKFAMWGYSNGWSTALLLNRLFKEGVMEPSKLSASDIAGYKVPLLEGKTKGMYRFFTQTCNRLKDYESVMAKIDAPAAIIWGEHDTMLKWDSQSQKVKKLLNLAEENIYRMEAKHFLQEEIPQELNKVILGFIREN